MTDAKPKRGRRRRGRSRNRKNQSSPESQSAATQNKPQKETSRPRSQGRGGRGSRQERSPKREKLTVEEVFGRMTRDFPPEYGDLPEFIKSCRAMRENDTEYTEDEFFYFIATSVETLTEDKIDELFNSKYSDPLKEIREKEGLEENQYWKPDDSAAPDEYRRLLDEFRDQKREILANSFQNLGENQIGTLIEEDYNDYQRRKESGKTAFYARHKFEAVRMEPSEMDLSLSSGDEPDGVEPDTENHSIE